VGVVLRLSLDQHGILQGLYIGNYETSYKKERLISEKQPAVCPIYLIKHETSEQQLMR
jgi:hypothetical protein